MRKLLFIILFSVAIMVNADQSENLWDFKDIIENI